MIESWVRLRSETSRHLRRCETPPNVLSRYSVVNGSVHKRFAKLSSGAHELVASEKQVDEAMHRFADEIRPPAVLGPIIQAEAGLQTALARLPGLYHGRSTSIYERCSGSLSSLKLTGFLPNDEPIATLPAPAVRQVPLRLSRGILTGSEPYHPASAVRWYPSVKFH